MKKYIVIALAALVAFAACTKVNPEEKKADKISFQVATYLTKAQGNNCLAECPNFFTNAWYNPVNGNAQYYMQNVEILPDDADAPTQWAPAEAYYWPKTGKINFFSYASKNALAATELDFGVNANPVGSKFKITGHKVVADDNIMIADAVYNASQASHNADGAAVTDDLATGTTDSKFTGVPTMFRHLLAQVKFNIGLATATPTTGTTNYIAKVTSAKVEKVLNTGTLELTAGDATGTTLETKPWTPASDGTVVGWTAGTAVEDLALANTTALKLAAGATTGNAELFLDFTSVLPQALSDNVVVTITYDLQTLHGTEVYLDEKGITVTGKLNVATIKNWCMNKRYTYTITIDPVTDIITFDPAVAEWTSATDTIKL